MDVLIYVVLAVLVALVLFFVSKGSGAQKKDKSEDDDSAEKKVKRGRAAPVEAGPSRVAGARRRRGNIKSRIQQQINEQAASTSRDADSDDELGEGADGEKEDVPSAKKIGAKKAKKLAEKEERRLQREAEEQEREERRKQQEERDEERRIQEQKEKEEEERELEAERKIKEEKERREHEEYLKLKEMFSVDEEGQAEVEADDSENQLQMFIKYIKDTKVVLLEDIASHFGLRTQQAIDRVQDLLKDELITGVIDDRGKFIYISEDELKGIADFIKQRGRVSIAEVAKASNSLVNLVNETEGMVS